MNCLYQIKLWKAIEIKLIISITTRKKIKKYKIKTMRLQILNKLKVKK